MSPEADRRPIAARKLRFSTFVTSKLVQLHIHPNTISTWSMVFGAGAGACLYFTSCESMYTRGLFVGAALFVLLRLLANMFDGMVAVESGTESNVGELFNEVPDRVSDTAILVGAGYASGGWILLGVWAALMAMMTAYVRAVGKAAGAKQQFCGPMAKQQRMFLVIVTSLLLAVLPAAWQPSFSFLGGIGLMGVVLLVIAVGSALTSLRRWVLICRDLEGAANAS